jgi:predicted SAM-dependent methyltransferase
MLAALNFVRHGSRWIAWHVGRRIARRLSAMQRRFVTPPLPENPGGEVLIHLGCGEINAPGFINVDARPAAHVHYVVDVTDLSMFDDETADLVYACHVFEHFLPAKHREVLWEWRRILKPGGVLRLSVPDFDKLVGIYQACGSNVADIVDPLLGSTEDGYPAHRWLFNQRNLRDLMRDAGFEPVRTWSPDDVAHHDFEDWASKPLVRNGKDWPLSLNLEGVKEP